MAHNGNKMMPESKQVRVVGINHIAIEVDDLDDALEFYGKLFDFELRKRTDTQLFIDLGDQFINVIKGRHQVPDVRRHFGLVVEDREAVRALLKKNGIEEIPSRFLKFMDPWGNRVEIISYENIQFSKAPNVLRGMGLEHIKKNDNAIAELMERGMAPESK